MKERISEVTSGGTGKQLEEHPEIEQSELDNLSRDALIALVIRCNGWQMALKTPAEIAEQFKTKLAMNAMSEKDMFKALPIMREWFDREMGEASQSVSLNVKDDRMDKLPIDQLIRLAAMLDEPVIIRPLISST